MKGMRNIKGSDMVMNMKRVSRECTLMSSKVTRIIPDKRKQRLADMRYKEMLNA